MNLQGLIVFVKKHPIGVGCAVVALVLLVLTFARGGSLDELETKLQDSQDQGARLKNNLRYSSQLEEHLATMEQAVAAVESKTINPAALATNLQFFYRLEQDLGLTLIDLNQGRVEEGEDSDEYIAVTYQVTVEGTYLQLLDFLQRLEEGGRLVKFVTLSLTLSRGTSIEQTTDPTDPRLVLSLDLALLGRS
jgi:Tfp pilus assembly protein PilO